MTLIDAEKVPLSQGFNFGWEIIGGDANADYNSGTIETESFGCGVVGNEFESFDEVLIFAAFDLAMTLDGADVEPLALAFNVSFRIIGGATVAIYNETSFGFGCVVTANYDGESDEVFIGGTLTRSVYVPFPAEDLTHPNTRVALKFAVGSRVYLGAR